MTLDKIIKAGFLSGLLGLMASCGSADSEIKTAGCTSNQECKGGRVCYKSACVERGEVPDSGVVGSDGGTTGDDSEEGKIVFVLWDNPISNIYSIKIDGTELTELTADESVFHDNPLWSPDGNQIVFYSEPNGSSPASIDVMNADGSGKKTIWDNPSYPISDSGFSWSPNGDRILAALANEGNFEIYSLSANGGDIKNLTNHPADDYSPDWSPDGSKITFSRDNKIYTMNEDGSNVQAIVTTYQNQSPRWSPDGNKIAFQALVRGINYVFTVNSDGSALTQITEREALRPSWSPDGKQLAVMVGGDIYLINADGSGEGYNLTNTPETGELSPDWSPR